MALVLLLLVGQFSSVDPRTRLTSTPLRSCLERFIAYASPTERSRRLEFLLSNAARLVRRDASMECRSRYASSDYELQHWWNDAESLRCCWSVVRCEIVVRSEESDLCSDACGRSYACAR